MPIILQSVAVCTRSRLIILSITKVVDIALASHKRYLALAETLSPE